LEHSTGPVTRRDPDRRPLSRQADPASNRSSDLWLNRRTSQTVGNSPLLRTGQRQAKRHCPCAPSSCRRLRRCCPVQALHLSQSPPHAVSTVPQTRPLHLVRPSKPDVKSPSEPVSSAPGCTGPWLAPTALLLFGAAVSAGGSKISGNAEMVLSPLDPQICAVHPNLGLTIAWRRRDY